MLEMKKRKKKLLGFMLREVRFQQHLTQKEVIIDSQGKICSRRTLCRVESGKEVLRIEIYHRLIKNLGYTNNDHPLLYIILSQLSKQVVLAFYSKDDFFYKQLLPVIENCQKKLCHDLFVSQYLQFLYQMLVCLFQFEPLSHYQMEYYKMWLPFLSKEMGYVLRRVILISQIYPFCQAKDNREWYVNQRMFLDIKCNLFRFERRYGRAFFTAFRNWKYARMIHYGDLQVISLCQMVQFLLKFESDLAVKMWKRIKWKFVFPMPPSLKRVCMITEMQVLYQIRNFRACYEAMVTFVHQYPSDLNVISLNFIRSRIHMKMVPFSIKKELHDPIYQHLYEYQMDKIKKCVTFRLLKELFVILFEIRQSEYRYPACEELVSQEMIVLLRHK
ncbi:MAG: hypothetical protein PUF50_08490 [Erysipelotrichaceae bacterium]|nr:hypothetical protein [Erysipelotrichaceae bacterium]